MRTILYRILQALVLVAVASSFAHADNFMYFKKRAAAGGGCTGTPNGSVFTEGFETAYTTCGSAPCWTESGETPDESYALPGTPPTGACSKGLRTNSTGTITYSSYNANAARTDGVFFNVALIIPTEGLVGGSYQNTDIIQIGNNSNPLIGLIGRVNLLDSNGTLYLRPRGATDNTGWVVSTNTWYVVTGCFAVGTETGNFCGTGVNGRSWMSVNGAAHQEFTGSNNTAAQYYTLGPTTAARTVDVVFGYFAADADGNY